MVFSQKAELAEVTSYGIVSVKICMWWQMVFVSASRMDFHAYLFINDDIMNDVIYMSLLYSEELKISDVCGVMRRL